MPDQDPVNNIQEAFDQLAQQAEAEHVDKKTYSFGELYATKDEEQKFLIPDLLPAHAVALFIGEDGIGKTQLLTQLCLQIAMGKPTFLTLPLITKHKASQVIATEDSKQKFIAAASKQFKMLGPEYDPNKVNLKFTEGADFNDYPALIVELVNELKREPKDLVVIDAMSDLFTLIDGEINSNAHARKILQVLQSVCKNHETTIVIIHHAAKTKLVEKRKNGKLFVEKDDSQGAGALTQKPRTVLALTHDRATVTNNGLSYKNFLHVAKANLMSKFYVTKAIELNFDASTLVHNFSQLVIIEEYEKGDRNGTPEQPQPGPPDPVTARQLHDQHLRAIYAETELYTRADLVKKIMEYYQVGHNKVESKGGIFSELVEMQLIIKDGKFWAYANAPKAPPPPPPPGFFDDDYDPEAPPPPLPPESDIDDTPF